LRPAFASAFRKAIGATEGRELRGLLLPRGAVTPQATFSDPSSVEWTPV
jgi:hypothetical protein